MKISKASISEINDAVSNIKQLAALDGCGVADEITERVKLWLQWFGVEAGRIEAAIKTATE